MNLNFFLKKLQLIFNTFVNKLIRLKLLRKDKIKIIISLLLTAINLITYFIIGKEGNTMKIVAVSSLVIWLITMYITNKKQ